MHGTRGTSIGSYTALWGLALLLLGGVFAGVFAGDALADDGLRTPRQRGVDDERLATTPMWGLHWHDSWKDAVLLNRLERRKPVPIFHLRILGDLKAKT